jgi:hypothetical protein
MIDFIVEFLIKPFFSEKLRVLKYYDQKYTAKRLLGNSHPHKIKKGISLLFELAISYPYRVQEIINEITAFLRQRFPQEKQVHPEDKELLELGIRSLAAISRLDSNGFPYDFDLHQIRIEDLNLTRTNFRFFSLWGCQFHNVILSHSSFEEADLGGTVFESCSLEYSNLKQAKLCASFMDQGRPSRFRGTRLWGSNLKDADIECCELHIFDKVELPELQEKVNEKKIRIIEIVA